MRGLTVRGLVFVGLAVVAISSSPACFGTPPDIPPKRPVLDRPITCPKVTVYGAEWCVACVYAERHLQKRGVVVIKRDIEEDDLALAEARKMSPKGKLEIPLIDVCGDTLRGYQPDRIDDALIRPR